MAGSRESFVLGLTLTELTLILFFLLLLLASLAFSKQNSLARERESEYRTVREKIDAYNAALAEIFAGTSLEQADLIEDKDEFRELIAGSQLNKEERENLQRQTERLQSQLREVHEERLRSEKEYEERIAELAAEMAAFSATRDESSTEKVADLLQRREKELRNLKGQLKNLQRRCSAGKGGIDWPPCWADDDGRPQYLYYIVINERDLAVEKAWPAARDQDVTEIPGAMELLGQGITESDFRRGTSALLRQSKEKECRHFVQVYNTATTLGAYKSKMEAIEEVFYKFERKDPR